MVAQATNNFSSWTNTEVIKWVADYEEFHVLCSQLNLSLYHQAIAELYRRFPEDEHYKRKNYYYTKVNCNGTYFDYVTWLVTTKRLCDCNGCRVCECR